MGPQNIELLFPGGLPTPAPSIAVESVVGITRLEGDDQILTMVGYQMLQTIQK